MRVFFHFIATILQLKRQHNTSYDICNYLTEANTESVLRNKEIKRISNNLKWFRSKYAFVSWNHEAIHRFGNSRISKCQKYCITNVKWSSKMRFKDILQWMFKAIWITSLMRTVFQNILCCHLTLYYIFYIKLQSFS